MNFADFISVDEASQNLSNPNYIFIDCSFSLTDKNWGYAEYTKGHIPGAVYVDLEKDLSGKIIQGVTGRHPLPQKNDLINLFSSLGINKNKQVVAYDSAGGYMAAARLWWLLKWAGHDSVAVLNGGIKYWISKNLPLSDQITFPSQVEFKANFQDRLLASSNEVLELSTMNKGCLIDSRTHDRYLGENETIDPVAGHIPTAISKPFNINIGTDGLIERKSKLRYFFKEHALKKNVVFYCGSGVTAAFNVLLYVYAGYSYPKLYAGSWSEWITDSNRPIGKKKVPDYL
jgi:thiosulfate/3-mercaptopyruvate sulfurtransferase